jgi:hypothetical protein
MYSFTLVKKILKGDVANIPFASPASANFSVSASVCIAVIGNTNMTVVAKAFAASKGGRAG